MTPANLSPSDQALAVRAIMDVRHFLNAINGMTATEAGVDPREADATTQFVMDTTGDLQSLAAVLRMLGYDPKTDPVPPPVGDQLAKILGYGSRRK